MKVVLIDQFTIHNIPYLISLGTGPFILTWVLTAAIEGVAYGASWQVNLVKAQNIQIDCH